MNARPSIDSLPDGAYAVWEGRPHLVRGAREHNARLTPRHAQNVEAFPLQPRLRRRNVRIGDAKAFKVAPKRLKISTCSKPSWAAFSMSSVT